MIKHFTTEGMKHVPELGEDFRVGPFIGTCVEIFFTQDEDSIKCVTMESKQPAACCKCEHCGALSMEDVAFCNCCENYEYFEPADMKAWLNPEIY